MSKKMRLELVVKLVAHWNWLMKSVSYGHGSQRWPKMVKWYQKLVWKLVIGVGIVQKKYQNGIENGGYYQTGQILVKSAK